MCKATANLTDTIGSENAENLVDMIGRAQERAVERKMEQDVTVYLDCHGYVRGLHVSDNIRGVKPAKYRPE